MKHWQRFAIAMLAVVCLFSSIAAMAVEENVFPIGDGSTKLSLYLPDVGRQQRVVFQPDGASFVAEVLRNHGD